MASDRIHAIISEVTLSDIPSSRLLACMKYKKKRRRKERGTCTSTSRCEGIHGEKLSQGGLHIMYMNRWTKDSM